MLEKSNLEEFENVSNLFKLIKLFEKESPSNSTLAHKYNAYVKKYSAKGCKSKDTAIKKSFFELNKAAYLFDARVDFESFLIYVEWDRSPEKRFYLPRRNSPIRNLVKAMQDLEDDKLDILTISLPPGVGKTTLGCFFLAWICGKYPDTCSIASAYGDKLTKGFYQQVYTIITDPEYLYKDVFPEVFVQSINSKDQTINLNSQKRFKTLTCRSISGALTGSTRCEKYLYCDDLVSGMEEALNIERLDNLWFKFLGDLRTRTKLGFKEIHIATRWSIHDIIGRIQKLNADNPRARFISVPALDENGESNFDFDYKLGFTTELFNNYKNAMDNVTWSCLYMNSPMEREGRLFKEEEMNFYKSLPDGKPDKIIAFCDVAWGGGDFLSMPIGQVYGKDLYIVDVAFSNEDKEHTRPLVSQKLAINNVEWARFEANNGGDEYADNIRRMLKENYNYGIHIDVRRASSKVSKNAKIIQNSFEISKCYFKSYSIQDNMYRNFMLNLLSFNSTGTNKHDDAPDSMAGIVTMAFKDYGIKIMQRPF